MHQQVRTRVATTEAPGAMNADNGGIVALLRVLRDADVNMQAAGGRELNGRGEFVFSVHHGDENPDETTQRAVEALQKAGYRPYTVKPRVCEVNDETGGLLGCLEEVEARGDQVAEIHIGTGSPVPIQVVTRRHLDEADRGGGYGADAAG